MPIGPLYFESSASTTATCITSGEISGFPLVSCAIPGSCMRFTIWSSSMELNITLLPFMLKIRMLSVSPVADERRANPLDRENIRIMAKTDRNSPPTVISVRHFLRSRFLKEYFTIIFIDYLFLGQPQGIAPTGLFYFLPFRLKAELQN